MAKEDQSTFGHFFNEQAEEIQEVIGKSSKVVDETATIGSRVKRLSLPKATTLEEDEFKQGWRELRSFFRNGGNESGTVGALKPALLASQLGKAQIASDFPLWISDELDENRSMSCAPLRHLVESLIEKLWPAENEAHILKANVDRIVHIANDHFSKDKNPKLFATALGEIFEDLKSSLDIAGDEGSLFFKNLNTLKTNLPQTGVLIAYTESTPFQLLEAAIVASLDTERESFKKEVKLILCRLKDILRVEREKRPKEADQKKLKGSMDFAESFVDFDGISSVLPDSGSEVMTPERIERINKVVTELESAQHLLADNGTILIEAKLFENKTIAWNSIFESREVRPYSDNNGCAELRTIFHDRMSPWSDLVKNIRIGNLEFNGIYQPEIHDDYFANFSWDHLNDDELLSAPQFILVADSTSLIKKQLNELSTLLSENIPVNIVAVRSEKSSNHSNNGSRRKIAESVELASLVLSHKNIVVCQSSAIHPETLFDGYLKALQVFTPSFTSVISVEHGIDNKPFLQTSAAIESRDFPGFNYYGTIGRPWGSRFEIVNNPQPDMSWPIHQIDTKNSLGEDTQMAIEFTYADYLVLNSAYHGYFKEIERGLWSDELRTIPEFLSASSDEIIGKVPYIWMTGEDHILRKVAVAHDVIIACQERLDYWTFLQENSGINNFHVKAAVEKNTKVLEEQFEQRLADLKAEHQTELDEIRNEEAGKVMEKLTSVLLGMDVSTISTSPVSGTVPSSKKQEKESVEDAPVTEAVAAPAVSFSADPYIDTAMCTSCNECINLNQQMFKYNADKMAFIDDPKAGSFKDLVEAAEKCPVKIIHPGEPMNPNEPDLESLKKRAEKFN